MNRKQYKRTYVKFAASYFMGALLSVFALGLLFSTLITNVSRHLPVILLTCLATFAMGVFLFRISGLNEKEMNEYERENKQ